MTDKLHGKNLRIWIFALLGGIVFAAFDRCGYMIQHYGTLWAISENPLHKTIFHRILIRVPLFTAGVLISFLLLNWLRGEHRFWCWFAEERIAGQHSATDCHGKVFGIM